MKARAAPAPLTPLPLQHGLFSEKQIAVAVGLAGAVGDPSMARRAGGEHPRASTGTPYLNQPQHTALPHGEAAGAMLREIREGESSLQLP